MNKFSQTELEKMSYERLQFLYYEVDDLAHHYAEEKIKYGDLIMFDKFESFKNTHFEGGCSILFIKLRNYADEILKILESK